MAKAVKYLTIYQTSDVHGYLYPTSYQNKAYKQNYGLFKLSRLYKQDKASLSHESILIDNGDFLQGSPLSYYVFKHDRKADRLMQAYNELPIDVGVIGNHEFNYGQDYLDTALATSAYPILAANILNKAGEVAYGKPYEIIKKDGIKIGVLGLTTQYIPNFEHPSHIQGLNFESAVKTAKRYLPELRGQVDLVVVSYHGGFEGDVDNRNHEQWSQTGENECLALLKSCHEWMDMLLTGHQHRLLARELYGVPVVMPGQKGSHLGKITVELNYENEKWVPKQSEAQLLTVDESVVPNPHLEKKYHQLNQEVETWLDTEVGQVVGDNMSIEDVHQARIYSHPYIAFINQVQMHYGGADISATSLFNDKVKGFNQNITMRDIVSNYVFPNTLAVSRIKGYELKAALEQTAEYFEMDDGGQSGVSDSWIKPKPQVYNYDLYSGIDYTFDITREKGDRVIQLEYKGEPVKANQELTIVLNQYRAVGGGDYHMFGSHQIIREVSRPMTELIAEYISTFNPINISQPRNFKVKK